MDVTDVPYSALVEDPDGQLQTQSGSTRPMPSEGQRRHAYDVEAFGLDRAELDARFKEAEGRQ